MKNRVLLCLLLLLARHYHSLGQDYIFAQLKGTPMNTAGWTLKGDAHVGNIAGTADSELVVCSLNGSHVTPVGQPPSSSGAIFFNQPINLSRCPTWIAEFDFRLFDGDGADGLAFCFLDIPP